MKKALFLLGLICLISGILIIHGCKKDPGKPILTTKAVSGITLSTATSGGNITSDGGAAVTASGICWSTSSNPKITNSKTTDGTKAGAFTSGITGLTPNTLYYVRAYATNSVGTAYGNEVSFTTNAIVAGTLTTTAVTSITLTTAVSGGNITADGGAAITARGICWATTTNPTISNDKTTDATGIGIFTSNLSGLLPGSTYYVRAYATNSLGTAYGNEASFTTMAIVIATLTTTEVTAIVAATAVSGGNITADGGGTITARGVCWATATNPTIVNDKTTDATGTGTFVSNLINLLPGTTYFVRAYATNSSGTAYGNELTFTTVAVIPGLTTTAITGLTISNATSGGNITSDGGAAVSVSGICWALTTNPTITDIKTTDGTLLGSFTSIATGLSAGTTYYVRAYATNSVGTAYGNLISFNTKIADIEGNTYNTVTIGAQVWMAENLKTTRYNNNSAIPYVTDNVAWFGLAAPAFCWYNNNESTNKPLYGALYNWFTVNTGNLCPTGWHVPTEANYVSLELFLGMAPEQAITWGYRMTNIGAQMKNTTGWAVGENGTNTSGFSALPGGYRNVVDGSFNGSGMLTYWWNSTEDPLNPSWAWYRLVAGNNVDIFKASTGKTAGKSVRCVKD